MTSRIYLYILVMYTIKYKAKNSINILGWGYITSYTGYNTNDKGLTIEVLDNEVVTQTLINNMVNLLKDLEEQYPENIEVK